MSRRNRYIIFYVRKRQIKNLDFLLIFDLSIWSRNDEYGELGNLMKNHSFNFKTGSDWPDVTQLVSQ